MKSSQVSIGNMFKKKIIIILFCLQLYGDYQNKYDLLNSFVTIDYIINITYFL